MNTITISTTTTSSLSTRIHAQYNQQSHMTSLEIADICGKPHNDILKAIRKMEPAWEKVSLGKFSQSSRKVMQPNGGVREFWFGRKRVAILLLI